MTHPSRWPACLLNLLLPALAAAAPPPVEFNRDIRPILSDACFHCHGPDTARRKADLRLDTEAGAFADLGDTKVITPGQLGKSELYQRLIAPEARSLMPPAKSGRKLTAAQIDLVKRWIEQGAKWQPHWSFVPPTRPPLPAVQATGWLRNPIDAFILARLEKEGLSPAVEAERATLVRRVTLDLTGLPPTLAELDAALNDRSPQWYETVVDRLLASPRYGEHFALRWLDAARYADTNGYQSDGERTMWRWRDWVIDAFNANLPFDRFTVEQLAGDLLPNPTLEQRIATGFNRNHRGNAEGGIIPEEYAVEYVADRVETTATVWLGLTLGCARCHDHKYDPVAQQEFYQLFAFFNNVPERGKAVKYGNSPPVLRSPTPDQQAQLARLDEALAAAHRAALALAPAMAQAERMVERELPQQEAALHWAPTRHLAHTLPLDRQPAASFRDGAAAYAPGQRGDAADFDGKRYVEAGDVGRFGFLDKFSISAWVRPRGSAGGPIVTRMTDAARADGYAVRLDGRQVHVHLVKRWLDDAIRVHTEETLTADAWHHVLVTYDGTRLASGIQVYLDGKPARIHVDLDELNQSFETKEPLRIGAGGADRFHGLIDEVRLYRAVLAGDDALALACTDDLRAVAKLPSSERTPWQAALLRGYVLDQRLPAGVQRARLALLTLREERERYLEQLPTTMVMAELPTPRDTFVLLRGEYDKRGAKVTPGVPAVLPALKAHGTAPAGLTRLDLARWLTRPDHPLTARVAVNRWWQHYFGTGLVKTVDDFGAQGEWPSHPELLDWLATEFVRTGWDVKALQRLIVTSAAYRQSSRLTKALLERDPENRLLARGPRFRLSAEAVRDQALALSGMLVERSGGPSVKPYQPAGLWKDLVESAAGDYVPDRGASLYRRSLYTFWKRTVAPPGMVTFDAAGREFCQVRQSRTNTPLQALNLMNDVTYVEAARVLAQRVLTAGGTSSEQRLTFAFRLATARTPRPTELQVLQGALQHHQARYSQDAAAAQQLIQSGEYPRDPKLAAAELAAWTAVAGVILNLDETITKE